MQKALTPHLHPNRSLQHSIKKTPYAEAYGVIKYLYQLPEISSILFSVTILSSSVLSRFIISTEV